MEFRLNQRHIVAFNFLLIAGIAYYAARSVDDMTLQNLQGAPLIPAAVSAKAAMTKFPRSAGIFTKHPICCRNAKGGRLLKTIYRRCRDWPTEQAKVEDLISFTVVDKERPAVRCCLRRL